MRFCGKTFGFFLALSFVMAQYVCAEEATKTVTLRVAGGSAPMENVFKRLKRPFEKQHPNINLELIESGPVDAWNSLVNDTVDVASAGMVYPDWAKYVDPKMVAALEKPSIKLQRHIIGTDYVTVYTHPGVGVIKLTKDEVKRIFTGKANNWKSFGGPDMPIIVVVGEKVAGLTNTFINEVLDGESFVGTAKKVDTANQMKEYTQITPGAISIGTLAQVQDDNVKMIDYPMPMRFIYMMWKFVSPKQPEIDALYQFLCSTQARPYILAKPEGYK